MPDSKTVKNILKPSYEKRVLFFLITDTLVFFVGLFLGLLFRFNFDIPKNYGIKLEYWVFISAIIKIAFLWFSDVYKLNWRFVSINEFYKIVKSLFLASILIYFGNAVLQKFFSDYSLPRSSVIIDFFVSTFFVLMVRASRRVYFEIINPPKIEKTKRTLIIGAGDSGERIVRELKKGKNEYEPIVFVDDDLSKQNTIIHQIRVEGTLNDIEKIVKKHSIDSAIIAITTLHHSKVKNLFDRLNKIGIKEIKIVPTIDRLPSSDVTVKDLKDISIEDLLARETIEIDSKQVGSLINGKVVMVTGAGGSIGSEIVNQLFRFNPKIVIGYEIDETELHTLQLRFKDKPFEPIVGDVKDRKKIEETVKKYRPSLIFHAAAYKHVPMMERFPEEAVQTNVFGTFNLVKIAMKYGVEKFINISTDKAVNPTSIMGATKRVAEMICRAYDKTGTTKFISVRFGNVLGSRGSAVPIFIEQIKKGGPVTVTHPEMKRYFMSIPEAVLLVFQAASMGEGGEVFVLDMGEPVKIVDLVERLIKLEGFEPYKDIDITFTGIREGEKLFEELLTAEEGTLKTKHSKIYTAKIPKAYNIEDITFNIEVLKNSIQSGSREVIKERLKKLVHFFKDE